jgi:Ku protein, prokaryotic
VSARATWKGFLKISLVTIPIKVFPATESAGSISFNQLHAECQTRMQQKKWCPKCAIEVASKDIVKGFEFEKGRYVILIDEELDAVQPESTKVIDLTQFAKASALDPIAIDRTYYLAPDGERETYGVLRVAMAGLIGVGKLALYGREYLVAVRPLERALVLHTLHHAAEIRPIAEIEGELHAGLPVHLDRKTAEIALARQVIAAFTGPLNLAAFTDAYQTDLRRIIDAKIAGQEIIVSLPVADAPVLTLRAALEQSLEAVSATKKVPAKVSPAAKRKRA